MTFLQLLEAHYTAIGLAGLFLFKTAVNAFPPKDQPFVWGAWFREWLLEIGQQAPSKVAPLSPSQAKVLGDAGVPLTLAPPISKPAPEVKP